MSDQRDGDEPSGLPPRAPAYDLRTGEPLDAPRPEADREPAEDEFSPSELGIWAPSADPVPAQDGPRTEPTVAQRPTPPPAGPPAGLPPAPTRQGPPPWSTAPPGWSPTAHQPAAPQPPGRPRRRAPLVLGAVVGVLVVVVAVLVAVLALGGDGKTPVASSSPSTGATGGASAAPSASGGAATGGSGTSGDSRLAFLRTVDGILIQSASGRQQVSAVVTGVQNSCSVAPQDASATIRQVLVNRRSVLGQADALDAPDPATVAVKANLVRALTASIQASEGYQRWLDELYTTYYNDDPVGCPDGQAPTDANFDAATAASGRATAAKRTFVSSYNPLASGAGLRTWQESEF